MFGKSGDVLDLTDLQRRGLLKVPEKKVVNGMKVNAQGYVDLRAPTFTPTQAEQKESAPSFDSSGAGALGFLDSLATSTPQTQETPSYFSASSSTSTFDSLDVQGLKNKIEDLEYKLERLMEKIAKLESAT